MQRHSEIGERIVAAAPTLHEIAPIIRSAHERVDGTGYPDGLRLEQIPICSRIIAVVDAYDAMTTDRPYQQAMSERRRRRGARPQRRHPIRPTVVTAFTSVLAESALPDRAATTPPTGREGHDRNAPLPPRARRPLAVSADDLTRLPDD